MVTVAMTLHRSSTTPATAAMIRHGLFALSL
jgi:hypothetical protein